MAKHLYRNCEKNNWLEKTRNEACVALRTFQGEYIVFPLNDSGDEKYERAVKGLNVEVSHFNHLSNNRFACESILMLSRSS